MINNLFMIREDIYTWNKAMPVPRLSCISLDFSTSSAYSSISFSSMAKARTVLMLLSASSLTVVALATY